MWWVLLLCWNSHNALLIHVHGSDTVGSVDVMASTSCVMGWLSYPLSSSTCPEEQPCGFCLYRGSDVLWPPLSARTSLASVQLLGANLIMVPNLDASVVWLFLVMKGLIIQMIKNVHILIFVEMIWDCTPLKCKLSWEQGLWSALCHILGAECSAKNSSVQ